MKTEKNIRKPGREAGEPKPKKKSTHRKPGVCYELGRICELVKSGYSIRQISKMPGMPSESWLYDRMIDDLEFGERYALAREARADRMFEEILEIADNAEHDTFRDRDGREQVDRRVIERCRLMIDSRKWILAKMAPKKYGDKLELKHTTQDFTVNFIASPNPEG